MPATTPPSNPPPDLPPADRPPAPFPSLDQLSAAIPPVTWLWPGWIPRGMITLLCAAPGAGKSYFALDIARRLIAGLPWPDDVPSAAAAGANPAPNVVYVDAEAAPQILNARALAWGLDRSHLFPMLAEPNQVLDLNTPACQARLEAMVAALGPALVIVDSLGSAARGAENQAAAVDALFGFLNRLAARSNCALLLIHHLRKQDAFTGGRSAGVPLAGDDVRGSGHIVSLARSVLGLAPVQIGLDPHPDAPRRLQLLKTNLGPFPAPLGITFEPSAGGGIDLAFGPAPEPLRLYTAVESCARWLLDVLTACYRPLAPRELIRWGAELGYSRATLYRARELLGSQVVDTVGRYTTGNRWAVPPYPRPGYPPDSEPPPPRPSRPRKQPKPAQRPSSEDNSLPTSDFIHE